MYKMKPDSREWWLNEARLSASDGAMHAALFAMANVLLPPELVATPSLAKPDYPDEIAELERYAMALGLEWAAEGDW